MLNMSKSAWICSQLQKIEQKLVNIWNNDIAAASDHAALRVPVMQWRLDVIKNALTVFVIAINRKFYEINLSLNNWSFSRGLLENIHLHYPLPLI